MRKIIAIRSRSKKEVEEALRMAEEIDSRVEAIQALIPLGLEAVNNLLQKEVRCLAGERYRREGKGRACGREGCGPQYFHTKARRTKQKRPCPRRPDVGNWEGACRHNGDMQPQGAWYDRHHPTAERQRGSRGG